MNQQKPEGPRISDGSTLDFHSMFFTLQGEGPFAGNRAIFIRLAGCNLQCPGCDTEYTQGRIVRSVDSILMEAQDLAAEHVAKLGRPWPNRLLVVITGGEPLRQNIGELVNGLIVAGFRVQIESNGFFAPDQLLFQLLTYEGRSRLSLVVSPKTAKINATTGQFAAAFKYVLDANSVADDGLPILALEHPGKHQVARPPSTFHGTVYLNPFDAGDAVRNLANLEAVAESCMKHGYTMGVQIHKLAGLA